MGGPVNAEGNITQKTGGGTITTYTWDHRNRLIEVNEGGTTVEYQYDAFNQLIRREVSDGTSDNETSFYIYDEGQIELELNSDGDVERRYLWGPAVDQLLAEEVSNLGGTSWALGDNLNSVRDWVNPNGTVSHVNYDSFGNVLNGQSNADDHLFGFTGRFIDHETGEQWNLNRWYDSETGRWLSEDPIGFAAGDANLYRYVGNEPNNWIDPLGLDQQDVEDAVMSSASMANLISGQQQVNENPSNAFNPNSPGFIPSLIANAIGSLFDAVPAAIAEGSEEARRQLECIGKESDNKFVEAVTEVGEALTRLGEASSGYALDKTQDVLEKGGLGERDVVYPPDHGFDGESREETLKEGTLIDRYGPSRGHYTAPAGTPIPDRALYPGTENKPYHVYRVEKPFTVRAGTTAPWFGKPGGGTQYYHSDSNGNETSVQQLVKAGFLSEVRQ